MRTNPDPVSLAPSSVSNNIPRSKPSNSNAVDVNVSTISVEVRYFRLIPIFFLVPFIPTSPYVSELSTKLYFAFTVFISCCIKLNTAKQLEITIRHTPNGAIASGQHSADSTGYFWGNDCV